MKILVLLAALFWINPAHAQPTPQQAARCDMFPNPASQAFCRRAYSAPALQFPQAAVEGATGNLLRMAIFKPPGPGPFPAIIYLHTCGAFDGNTQIPYWVHNAIARGYVAFVVDSFSARGIIGDAGCDWIDAHPIRVRDAFEAAAHLARFPFVDPARIAAQGFSQGARVAYLLASARLARGFSTTTRFAAVIATYGQCASTRPNAPPYLRDDTKTPLLALLGPLDDDGDPKTCLPLLEKLRAAGAPVEWQVFPNTGHVWDQPNRVSARRMPSTDPPGSVLFKYDSTVTGQSRDLAFNFLARAMPAKPR